MGRTYYKKPVSVVRYDENGLKYLEMLPVEVTSDKNIIDYGEVQDMRPTNNIEQEQKWYTTENARKRKAALPVVTTALASPALLVGGISAATGGAVAQGTLKALKFGVRAMTPSSYTGLFGTGPYNTVLGGTGASALGAAADSGLASYYITSAKREFDKNPNLRHGVELGLAALPLLAVTERKVTPISQIFEQSRWNRFRNPKYVTKADKVELESHFPEYKRIQELAMDEGDYMIVSENSPLAKLSKRMEDGRLLFQGDEGTFIQSKSTNFHNKYKGQTIKVGFKGGTDQKGVEGIVEQHTPETFPNQENGVFFAGDRRYADTYNSNKESPGFWLGFRRPYDMLGGNKPAFLLEDNNIRFVRGVESSPSFNGEFPNQTIETLHKIWNSKYINNPEIMEIITSDPSKMTKSLLALRESILKKILTGKNRNDYNLLELYINRQKELGKMNPLRGIYYDGFIGRDHTLGYGLDELGNIKDLKWPFGSNPETYVITQPGQASLLVGNNGAFSGSAYSRKMGGKINSLIKVKSK